MLNNQAARSTVKSQFNSEMQSYQLKKINVEI